MLKISFKRCTSILSLLTLICFLASRSAFAQGAAFAYQGSLTNSGTPANGSYDMQFKLFDSTDFVTGNQVGATITSLAVQVTNGAFTVQLDFGASVFSGAPRFLEIGVRPAGSPDAFTVLSPRQPLSSAPYAVRSTIATSADTATNAANAANAAQLGGIAASQYVVTTDARLSDARPPTSGSANYIQNSTSQQAATNFNISGNGTIGGNLSVGGSLSPGIVNAQTQYDIGGSRVLAAPGTGNLFAGLGAGASLTTGTENAFFGKDSGTSNTSGALNSFFGWEAGNANTTGGGNAFFGWHVGATNTTGCCNSFFGEDAGLGNTTGTDNSFFGIQAGGNGSTGSSNTFIGARTGFGPLNAIGNQNTLLGSNTVVSLSGVNHSTAIGYGARVSTSNTIVLGTTSDVVVIPGLGAAGSTSLCRNSSNQISTCSSSLRYKTEVQPFPGGLEIIRLLRPISFTWKQDGTRDLGLAAEDVARVEPLLVTHNDKGEIEGVKYDRITVALINAINQQQARIEQQQLLIFNLKKIVCSDHPDADMCREAILNQPSITNHTAGLIAYPQ